MAISSSIPLSAVPRNPARAHGRRTGRLPDLRDRYPLGATGLKVSPICLGMTADPATVCEAFDAGINFFFLTGDMHWLLYEGLRRGLRELLARGGGVRDDIVVGTVSYVTQREFCLAPHLEAIAAVSGLERADLTIAGGCYAVDLSVRLPLYRLHREGHVPGVRALGASFHDRAAAESALEQSMVDIGFVRFNAAHPGARRDLFPRLSAGAPLVYNFKTQSGHVPADECERLLEDDSWRPSETDHYRYVLSHAEVDGILCALSEPRHVRAMADALEEGPLPEDECDHLEELARRRALSRTTGT